jgi:glucose/arabinose dehydrogenase
MYATENGVDHLGDEKPDDLMFKVVPGAHHGWPYCFELGGVKHDDTNRTWARKSINCAEVPKAFLSFGPHAAPLGVTYFENAHPLLEGSLLVALHGSHEPELRLGYKIVRVTLDGKQEIFMDGFMAQNGERSARPVHILQESENAFFFSDDYGGRVFYVYAE